MNFTFDEKTLYEVLNAFHSLTKMKIVINDHNTECIAAVPENDCAFCSAVRENPECVKKCDACKLEASLLCRQKKSLHIYKCHAGLVEVVAPIKIGDVTVGYMMLGQLLEDTDLDSKREDIIRYANSYAYRDITDCYKALTVTNRTEIEAAAKILESCACYLLVNRVIREDIGNAAFAISRYIEENVDTALTVEELCKHFSVSRNRLYNISETFFGMPIATFIRKKRMDKAMKLIDEGVSVTQTAISTGFYDYGYFGKVFKNETGMTPTEYAKKREKN